MPAVYLATTAVHMTVCLKRAKLVRLMLRVQVRMAIFIQRFVRKVQQVCVSYIYGSEKEADTL